MKRRVRGRWFRRTSADGDLGTGRGGVDAENLSSGRFRGEHNNSLSAWVRTLARQQVRCGTGRHCSLSPTSWTGRAFVVICACAMEGKDGALGAVVPGCAWVGGRVASQQCSEAPGPRRRRGTGRGRP